MMEHVKTSVINFHVIVLHVSQDVTVLLVSKLLHNAVSFIPYVLAVGISFKPVITTQPMNITGDLFSTVNLTCIADEGYPEPEIIWYKDGTKLRTQSTPNTLVIEELRPSDRGFYYCEAANVGGIATSNTVLVNIKGKLSLTSFTLFKKFIMYCIGVVQYKAFIRQNQTETMIQTLFLQQVTKFQFQV